MSDKRFVARCERCEAECMSRDAGFCMRCGRNICQDCNTTDDKYAAICKDCADTEPIVTELWTGAATAELFTRWQTEGTDDITADDIKRAISWWVDRHMANLQADLAGIVLENWRGFHDYVRDARRERLRLSHAEDIVQAEDRAIFAHIVDQELKRAASRGVL